MNENENLQSQNRLNWPSVTPTITIVGPADMDERLPAKSGATAQAQQEVLVIVHPGSACGSANFNIGRFEARAARDALVYALDHWTGGVIVIDGALSDELPDYPALDLAIQHALERSLANKVISHRMKGDDPDHVPRIIEFVQGNAHELKSAVYSVSGAWSHPEENTGLMGGCVGSTVQALLKLGCTTTFHESAVELPSLDDEDGDTEANSPKPEQRQ